MSARDVAGVPPGPAARRRFRGLLVAHPVVVDASVTSVYVLVLLPGLVHTILFPDPVHVWRGPVALAATLGTGAALMLRRRSPLIVLATALALVLVVKVVICRLFDPLGLALAGYAAAAYLPPRRAWISLPASVVSLVPAILFGVPLSPSFSPSSPSAGEVDDLLIIHLVCMITACLLGLLVRLRRKLRESEGRRLAHVQYEREQEAELAAVRARTALSREMHDVVGHSLTAIINISDGALRISDTRPGASEESLRRINRLARNALGETRTILGALRPEGQAAPRTPASLPHALPPAGVVDDAGDASLGLRELLATAESTGLTARMFVHGDPPQDPLDDEVRAAAHRIAQEAITNVMRHADGATGVTATITHAGEFMRIQVHDDGKSATQGPQSPQGTGLRGAAERAGALGGRLHSGPAPVGGWHVTAVLPYRGTGT